MNDLKPPAHHIDAYIESLKKEIKELRDQLEFEIQQKENYVKDLFRLSEENQKLRDKLNAK